MDVHHTAHACHRIVRQQCLLSESLNNKKNIIRGNSTLFRPPPSGKRTLLPTAVWKLVQRYKHWTAFRQRYRHQHAIDSPRSKPSMSHRLMPCTQSQRCVAKPVPLQSTLLIGISILMIGRDWSEIFCPKKLALHFCHRLVTMTMSLLSSLSGNIFR